MKTPKKTAGAKRTAETAELRKVQPDRAERKQRRGTAARKVGSENCGKTAEKLRNLSQTSVSAPKSRAQSASALVKVQTPEKRREEAPGAAPAGCSDGPETARVVVIASESWGWRATGPRAALLAAGVCTPAHFPTAPKRIAHGATSDGDGHWRVKLVSRGRWELMVSPSAEDCEVLRSQARERAVLAERAEQLALAQRLGPEAWRERRIDSMAVSFELVRDGFAGRFGSSAGFRLSDRSMRDLNAMLRRLELLVSNAEVLPDQSLSAPPDGPAKAGRPPRLRAPLHLVRDGC